MHELSIIETALESALRTATAQGASRIHRLGMRIGALTNVVPEALQFAFDVATRDTIAEGAALEAEYVAVYCRCIGCGCEFETEQYDYSCPACGALQTAVIRGRELQLTFVEVS